MASAVIDVTDASFDADVVAGSRERPVAVDFWAGWCAPCRTLGPILEQAVTSHGGVTLAKLDVDANPRTAQRFGIQGIPAVKGFRDGQLVAEFVGLQPRAQVERFLSQLAPPTPPPPLPSDEQGLRAALAAEPDNPALRRALGSLLLHQHRLDEAEEVLGRARDDVVCDGLRAQIGIVRTGPPELAALVTGDGDMGSLRRLIAAIRTHGEPERSLLRRVVLGAIEAERDQDPAVESLRGELASAIF